MQEPDAHTSSERPATPRTRPAAAAPSGSGTPRPGYVEADSPTVRKASGLGTGPGSSVRGVELVGGPPSANHTPPRPLPQVGDELDSFIIEQAIGAGGMGAVFRARDTRLDRHVALKMLPPEQADDPEVVQRFYQEGRSAARLDHENIARVYTIGHDGRYHYIAFEYIEGTTIRQRVERNGPLPVGEAVNYTLQIADALVHAAERGVVHRDIKPSNIIVTPHGRTKLVDMGLARRFERDRDDGLTQSGMTLGTFDYISPEQARDPRDVDVRSDLYSLGCTLFHMLTCRPPFPEGTVLQKLIQHQEEPPPDVRALNPAVPADLAAILEKLMAKDRDRRYQTPEQLVRDLLAVAGTLGLRSVSPEGLVWLSAKVPPAWEWHLVWGVPVAVFALIVAGVAWWTQDPVGSTAATTAESAPRVVKTAGSSSKADGGLKTAPETQAKASVLAPGAAGVAAAGPAIESPAPRPKMIDSTVDLLAEIAAAPSRSTLVLSDNGPYSIPLDPTALRDEGRLLRRDLTIRAEMGIRPVIRAAAHRAGEVARPALLDLTGGKIVFEGLEFVLDAGDHGDTLAAVRCEDTELTVRRCLFRREGLGEGRGPSPSHAAAVVVRSNSGAAAADDRPAAVLLDQCHVDGGQIGLLASGRVDLTLRDCTFGGCDPAVWLDNAGATAPVPADLVLRHVSLLAAVGPVFRFDGTEARVRMDDSVVAPSGDLDATLIATDQPAALSWRGRANLYARVSTYLRPPESRPTSEAVSDSSKWSETADTVRESGSSFPKDPVWDEPDPAQTLAIEQKNPSRAFRLAAAAVAVGLEVGARTGPFGSLNPSSPPPRDAQPARPADAAIKPQAPPPPANSVSAGAAARKDASLTTPKKEATPAVGPPNPAGRGESVVAGLKMNELPDMPMAPPVSREKPTTTGDPSPPDRATGPTAVAAKAAAAPKPSPAATVALAPAPAVAPAPVKPAAPASGVILRTVEQLLGALNQPGSRGGTLRVAADANWALAMTTVRTTGSWRIVAEPGRTRPRLRFVPATSGPRATGSSDAMIDLRAGALSIDGIDVVLPRTSAPRQGRWAAFAAWPATDLVLSGCTVTVEGKEKGVSSAVVVVGTGDTDADEEPGVNAPEPSAATVRFENCLLRAGDDLVDVPSGRRLVLELNNTVVATEGSLVHGHGLPRGQTAEPISVTLRQVTARIRGGLVQLQSGVGEPELPVTEVNARDSIFATTPEGAPLLRVDGQDTLPSLRDRVRWEGHGNSYHQVSIYRRDQSSQVGSVPTVYDQQSWTVAVGTRESAPVHGDLKFLHDWNPGRDSWTFRRDDAELAPDSPVRTAGPDLDRIPNPPASP